MGCSLQVRWQKSLVAAEVRNKFGVAAEKDSSGALDGPRDRCSFRKRSLSKCACLDQIVIMVHGMAERIACRSGRAKGAGREPDSLGALGTKRALLMGTTVFSSTAYSVSQAGNKSSLPFHKRKRVSCRSTWPIVRDGSS